MVARRLASPRSCTAMGSPARGFFWLMGARRPRSKSSVRGGLGLGTLGSSAVLFALLVSLVVRESWAMRASRSAA